MLKYALLLLAAPVLAETMISSSWECGVKDSSGNISPSACNFNPTSRVSAFNSPGFFSIANYAYGYAQTDIPGATVSVQGRQTASISDLVVVTGGTGSGELLFDGTGEVGSFDNLNNAHQSVVFQSNFLNVTGLNFFPVHSEVAFTFGVPLLLTLYSDIQVEGDFPLSSCCGGVEAYLGWESVDTWSVSLKSILDDQGNPIPGAQLADAPVPEPAAWLLLASGLVGIYLSATRSINGSSPRNVPNDC
jgi:hypothetical protein